MKGPEEKLKNPGRRRFVIGGATLGAAAFAGAGAYIYETLREETAEEFLNLDTEKIFGKMVRPLTESQVQSKKGETLVNSARNPKEKLSKTEVEDIIWNLTNESAISESKVGRMGILLCVIDRMLHKNNPGTATGVIYKKGQFSWVDYSNAFPLPPKRTKATPEERLETFKKIRGESLKTNIELIKSLTEKGTASIEEVRAKIVKELEEQGIKIPPTPLLFYKRHDWDHNNRKSKNYKRMSRRTVRLFKVLEIRMKERGETPVKIGNHNFYTATDF